MNVVFIIISFVISVYIAKLIIPRILLISFRKKLFDIPDERKLHKRAIPRLGGVSFFPTILFSCSAVLVIRSLTGYGISVLSATYILPEFLVLICGMVLLYLTGIADDLVGVRYRQKAINLIDGIDGLASGLSSVSLLVFGFLFIEKGLWIYGMLAFSTFGVLIPFFYYNVFGSAEHARKIFMGDTGSLTLGYILSFLAIKYSQKSEFIPMTQGAFVIAFSTLIVPCFDVVRVVIVRICNGKSPFEPDKNHIHHQFLAMGFTVRKSMLLILLVSCVFSVMNILLMPCVDNTLMLVGDIIVWIGLNLWWSKIRRKKGVRS